MTGQERPRQSPQERRGRPAAQVGPDEGPNRADGDQERSGAAGADERACDGCGTTVEPLERLLDGPRTVHACPSCLAEVRATVDRLDVDG